MDNKQYKQPGKTELFHEDGSSRGFYSAKNKVNDLTGKEWLFSTRSVITKPYPLNLRHDLRSQHGAQKPPDLCADIIRTLTKRGQTILDPLMGVGGVLLGAALSGRMATGIEINQKWIGLYKQVCREEGLQELECLCGDAACVLPTLSARTYDLVFTDVPYWKMDIAPRSKGRYKKVGEQSRPAPQSKLNAFGPHYADKSEWLAKMGRVFALATGLLKDGGYLATFVGDMYFANEYHCLPAELAYELQQIEGLLWKANIIWYDVSKKLHLYGYQYAYIPSLIHQNILVFRKEGKKKERRNLSF